MCRFHMENNKSKMTALLRQHFTAQSGWVLKQPKIAVNGMKSFVQRQIVPNVKKGENIFFSEFLNPVICLF